MKMIVIADDFTGSNDTGVQLAKKGARTEVMLTPDQKPSRRADVLVINTESRAMPAAEAGKAVAQALAPWCDGDARPLVYKKIDSTFRGNVGAEVTAAMRAANRKLAVIAAAHHPRRIMPGQRYATAGNRIRQRSENAHYLLANCDVDRPAKRYPGS